MPEQSKKLALKASYEKLRGKKPVPYEGDDTPESSAAASKSSKGKQPVDKTSIRPTK